MRKPRILKDQIEQGRQELSRLVGNHGMHDDKVLQQSMILDELINEYNRCRSEHRELKNTAVRSTFIQG
ncbi:aspartyl-phosphate phosphatase Spo0E family protein [Paenibacillus sp. QZ-Y1]|uniref:aspartyl-phosphate phosphatase Spo0E family protein n=1 Tax=Paenibacillus sp. QZ-Y1 TaxID=3414511 RepID=UPI003F79B8D7